MRLDRLIALVLIIVCFAAAIGNWVLGPSLRSAAQVKNNPDIALIEIYGGISDGPGGGSPFSSSSAANVNTLIEAIDKARKDDVKAILLHINSPGGTAAASEAIYHELMRTRKETDIKIVASLGDVAASGGYYIASAAHHIVANPATLTGSIGVIIRTQNVSTLLDKLGVQSKSFQSGKFKDILSPFRNTTADEQQLLETIVADSYQQFLEAIVAGRQLPMSEVKSLADGRIFTGNQAKTAKLVDSLGNYQDAIQETAKLAKIKGEPNIQNYTRNLSGSLLGRLLPLSSSSLDRHFERWVATEEWNKVPLALME